jgi:hypothetical protein
MSNDKAIAAVTQTLQRHLYRQLSSHADLNGAVVTTKPPDHARPDVGGPPQLNLFLYRTSIDAAWRNQNPPDARSGEDRPPALPLVLSYLITAYGENDDELEGHHMLGLAMRTLHDQPMLSRKEIAIASPGSNAENQVERIRITPHPIPMDEISRLWATFQTGYRISVSYDVAVVLIDSEATQNAAPPVLARGHDGAGPRATTRFPPVLTAVVAPHGAPAAVPGDTVTLQGRNLDGVNGIEVTGDHIPDNTVLPVTVGDAAAGPTITLPDAGHPLPAGLALLTPVVAPEDPDDPPVRGNTLALRLAPILVLEPAPLVVALDADAAATVKVTCSPPVQPGQSTALIVGDRIVAGRTHARAMSKLTFALSQFDAGRYLLRLRVDGQDSIPVDLAAPLAPGDIPTFRDDQYLTLT